jgi:hypothetical protein
LGLWAYMLLKALRGAAAGAPAKAGA